MKKVFIIGMMMVMVTSAFAGNGQVGSAASLANAEVIDTGAGDLSQFDLSKVECVQSISSISCRSEYIADDTLGTQNDGSSLGDCAAIVDYIGTDGRLMSYGIFHEVNLADGPLGFHLGRLSLAKTTASKLVKTDLKKLGALNLKNCDPGITQ